MLFSIRNKQMNNQSIFKKYTNTFIIINMQQFTLPQKIRMNSFKNEATLHYIYHEILVNQI